MRFMDVKFWAKTHKSQLNSSDAHCWKMKSLLGFNIAGTSSSSGTLINMMSHWYVMMQTQDIITSHPVTLYRHVADPSVLSIDVGYI